MLKEMLDNVRKTSPLIQNITNYVTANDCANITLAWGGSPIMSDHEEEAEDMARICMGLNINMGTLNPRTAGAMMAAGKAYNARKKPVILDPVGVGASGYRRKLASEFMEQLRFTVIKGNVSEIRTLITGTAGSRGVDADLGEAVTEKNLEQYVQMAKKFAADTGAVGGSNRSHRYCGRCLPGLYYPKRPQRYVQDHRLRLYAQFYPDCLRSRQSWKGSGGSGRLCGGYGTVRGKGLQTYGKGTCRQCFLPDLAY